jgi:hypothetical protein
MNWSRPLPKAGRSPIAWARPNGPPMTDALTGVLNRRGLIERWKRPRRDAISTGRPLALAVVDIDHFKRFNDRFGHAPGRRCAALRGPPSGRRLETDGGFVGRLGGEEFVGVLPAGPHVQADRRALTGRAPIWPGRSSATPSMAAAWAGSAFPPASPAIAPTTAATR